MAANNWRTARSGSRGGARHVTRAGPSFRKAADLDNSWDGLAAAHDAVLNLPPDPSPDKFLAQTEEWKRTLRQGCEKVDVASKLFAAPPRLRPGGLSG
jgi:hypothetical protein